MCYLSRLPIPLERNHRRHVHVLLSDICMYNLIRTWLSPQMAYCHIIRMRCHTNRKKLQLLLTQSQLSSTRCQDSETLGPANSVLENIFQVSLHAKGYFGTITRCPYYASVSSSLISVLINQFHCILNKTFSVFYYIHAKGSQCFM